MRHRIDSELLRRRAELLLMLQGGTPQGGRYTQLWSPLASQVGPGKGVRWEWLGRIQ